MATGDNQDSRVVGTMPNTKPDKEKEKPPPEAPLPSTEETSFITDVEQKPKQKTIRFGEREYLCHPSFPVRRFTKVQKALVGIAGKRGKDGTQLETEVLQKLMEDFDEVVNVLEILVVPDAWPELEERLDTNNSPYGSIDQIDVLEPIMDLFAQYGERPAGKRLPS